MTNESYSRYAARMANKPYWHLFTNAKDGSGWHHECGYLTASEARDDAQNAKDSDEGAVVVKGLYSDGTAELAAIVDRLNREEKRRSYQILFYV